MPEAVEPAVEPVTAPATEPQPATVTEADIAKYLSEKGLVAKTQSDIQREIDAAVGNTHKSWETTISEALGAPKPDGVKGLDWAKQTITKPKSPEPATAPELPTVTKVADEVSAARIKSLEEQLKGFQTEAEKAAERTKNKVLTLDMDAALKSSLDSKDDSYEGKSEAIRAALQAKYVWKVDELDNAVPYNKDGEALINPATSKPFTTAELIKKDFAFLLPKEKPVVTGTHRQPQETVSRTADGKPVTVGTYSEIKAKSQELGYALNSDEWHDFMDRSMKASGIDPKKLT